MKIFITWSGPLSRAVATNLRTWLRRVLHAADPWMSDEDIPSGKIWFDEININIGKAKYAILCVTQKNRDAPWLLWEAGALFRGFEGGRRCVVPLLIDVEKNDIKPPIRKFQMRRAKNKKEILHLLKDINAATSNPINDVDLEHQLDLYWREWQDSLESAMKNIPDSAPSGSSCPYTFKHAAEKFLLDKNINSYKFALDRVRV